MESKQPFDQWCLVEIMGHQRLAGRVTEEVIGSAALIRVDIPSGDGPDDFVTQYVGTGSIYRMTPTTESAVRAAVKGWQYRAPSPLGLPAVIDADVDADDVF